jgi:hypothetical protein
MIEVGPGETLRVLYVDALEAPNAKANVHGMVSAYRRVAEVDVFDYRTRARQYGQETMNRAMAETAGRFQPHFVHLGKCESVTGAGVTAIRRAVPGVVIIHFFGDYRDHVIPWVVNIGRQVDRTVMQIDGGALVKAYEQAGCKNVGYWPAGTDSSLYSPIAVGKEYDVVFMGTLGHGPGRFPWYEGRERLATAIASAGVHLHVFGSGWAELAKRPNITHHRYVGSKGFSEACSKAKVALAYSTDRVPGYTSWPRVLNTMACECFMLTRWFPKIDDIFENYKHLAWFKSIREAVELTRHYIEHEGERYRIAAEGRCEVLARHTWDHRIARMLEYAGFK